MPEISRYLGISIRQYSFMSPNSAAAVLMSAHGQTSLAHFCLSTEVPRRSAGINRPTVDETESTQVRMRLRKTSSGIQHPQLIHTLPGGGAGARPLNKDRPGS